MTISDTDKIDFLWKKIGYGVTKTANGSIKFASNESISSPLVINPNSIWTEAAQIPATPPATTSSIIEVHTVGNRIQATTDPSSPPYATWFATTTYSDLPTIVGNWIQPTYGDGYLIAVWVGDPNNGPAVRIFPDTLGYEYNFDYSAGVLTFPNNIPAGLTASVGSGTVSVSINGIYFEGYRYIGTTGIGNAGSVTGAYVSKTGDTMSGPLVFDYVSNSGQTVLLYSNSNTVAGMGYASNTDTRIFVPQGEALSFGHVSTSDGTTYTEDMRLSNGTLVVGGSGDGFVTAETGQRVVIGHTDGSSIVEDFVIDSNGVAYSQGYPILTALTGGGSGGSVLQTTGVNPGSYSLADITVDAYGRITSANNGSTAGTVTNVTLYPESNSIVVSSAPITISTVSQPTSITSSGTFYIDLANLGTTGTYTKVIVDQKGRVVSGSTFNLSDVSTALGFVPLANNQLITVSGDVFGSGSTAITLLLNSVVTAGTYQKVTVDTKGRVVAGANLNSADITSALGFTPSSTSGTVTSVTALGSANISISGAQTITGAGTFTFDLAATPVRAGYYTSPTIIVDASGRIVSAANGISSSGTVTSVSVASPHGTLSISGNPITTSGTISLDLANIITAGTYEKVSVDATGRVIAGLNLTNSDITTALGFTPLFQNQNIVLSGDATGSGSNAISITLANTLVTPGVYSVATITVDSKGRITNAVSGVASGTGTVTSVAANGDSNIIVSGSPITGAGTLAFSLSNTGVLAGTYEKVAVDVHGRVTSGLPLANTDITTALGFVPVANNSSAIEAALGFVPVANTTAAIEGALGFTPIANNQLITVSGDVSGSGQTSLILSLSNTGVIPGTYNVSTITVDAHGRITNAVSGTASGTGTVTSVNASGDSSITVSGGPITTSGSLSISLNNTGVVAGTYEKVTVDSKGRVLSGSSLANTDIIAALGYAPISNITNQVIVSALGYTPLSNTTSAVESALGFVPVANNAGAIEAALGFTPLSANQTITLSGDVSGSGSNAIAVTLDNTGVTPGSYTNANITVDSKGRITAVTNGTGGSGGGSLAITQSNNTITASASTLNFTGNGVSVSSGGSGVTEINIPNNYEYVGVSYGTGSNSYPNAIIANTAGVTAVIANSTFVQITVIGNYQFPPTSIAIYGQASAINTITYTPFPNSGSTITFPGGGTESSPTFFGSFQGTTITVPMDQTSAHVSTGIQKAIAYILLRF